MAVPFFFISAGFLLGQRVDFCDHTNQQDSEKIKKYLLRICKMYFIWMIVYTPIVIIYYVKNDYSFIKAVGNYLIGFFFVGQQYNNWILWYLLSTIYTVTCIWLLSRRGLKEKHLFILFCSASILVAIFSFIGNHSDFTGSVGLIQKVIRRIFSSGRIFNGFIYIPIGVLLSKSRLPIMWCWIMFVVGFAGRLLFHNEITTTLLLVLSSIGLFEIIERIELPDSKVYPALRNMSTTIYFIHLLIWTGYYMLVYGTKTYGLNCFIVTSIVSALIAFLYRIWLEKKAYYLYGKM